MAKRRRNYKREYARRKQLARERGLSLSQARGHPKTGERSVSEMRRKRYFARTCKEEAARRAIRRMTRGESMSRAARAEGISPSTVKRYGMEHGLLEHVPHEEARRFAPSYRAPIWRIRPNSSTAVPTLARAALAPGPAAGRGPRGPAASGSGASPVHRARG
jgi:hypothetical protein